MNIKAQSKIEKKIDQQYTGVRPRVTLWSSGLKQKRKEKNCSEISETTSRNHIANYILLKSVNADRILNK